MRSLLLLRFRGRDIRPAADLLSFASPKESKQRKGDPTVCVPSLRCGQPAVLDSGGGPQNSLRSNSCGPDPVYVCAPRRSQKGLGNQQAIATLGGVRLQALREAKARALPPPLWLRRGAQRFADQGSPLSERSEFGRDPAKREHRRLPLRKAKGTQTVGSPFSCLLFFGEAKKSRSPAGASPGPGTKTRQPTSER